MKTLMLTLIIALSGFSANATTQMSNKLIYKGKEYRISILSEDPILEEFFKKNPDRKPTGGEIMSSLWRGYIATFEFVNGDLYVQDIEILLPLKPEDYKKTPVPNNPRKSVMKDVFPTPESAKLSWFSGVVKADNGRFIEYNGIVPLHENMIFFNINKGKLIKEKQVSYSYYHAFMENGFGTFKSIP